MRARMFVTGLLLLPVFFLGGPALAQEAQPAEEQRTRIMLNESAGREVEQDTLVATLAAHAEAGSPQDAQAQVNETMEQAIATAATVEGVRRSTGGYQVYQQFDREGQPRNWVAEQDLRLTTTEAAGLLDLVGELQDKGLLLRGLAYTLSREAREALEEELTSAAIERVRARADSVAAALEMDVERIVMLRVGGVDDPPPMPRMMDMRAAQAESMAPPSALPDLETVTVTVEAEVALSPR